MLMPGIGNGYQMPDKYVPALQGGIRFFILRYPKRTYVDQSFFGPFDVKAGEEHDYGSGKSRYKFSWLTGNNAGVMFYLQPGTETAICFMPDDHYYHNKVLICDHPEYIVEGMQTPDLGIVNGNDVKIELDCVKDVLYYKAQIFKIIDPAKGNKEVTYKWTLEEAEEVLTEKMIRLHGRSGVPLEVEPYKKCKIVEGLKLRKRPEIENLIKRYARIPYGWTACDEFKNKYIPIIEDNVKAARNQLKSSQVPVTEVNMREKILDIISTLSEDEIRNLKNIKRPNAPEDVPVSEFDMASQPIDFVPEKKDDLGDVDVQHINKFKEYELNKMQKVELQQIAEKYGVKSEDMTRKKLIEAIIENQEEFVVT